MKKNIKEVIFNYNSKIILSTCSIRYLETIIINLCKKFFEMYRNKKNIYDIIKFIYKKDMSDILLDLIKKKDNLYQEDNNEYIYNKIWKSIVKNVNNKLGKRKRFDDNIDFNKIKKRILSDVNDCITTNIIEETKYNYELLKYNYIFKDWLTVKYSNYNDKILSKLSSIIEYTCCEFIDVTKNYLLENKITKYKYTKKDILESIQYDDDILYFTDKIKNNVI